MGVGPHSGHCVEDSVWLEVTPANTGMDTRGSVSRWVVTVGLWGSAPGLRMRLVP